ncbi:carboxypeptidase N subunit 2 [Lingula anatina]|uniref:Carboxypeptidase N subunit 2 n=1 Tax=Lingula anatina TaxID=7574 RepID=A0A1S3J1S0_LINAN|nr:carboxypeptidase N subunit 2 [Lingula anatina]|eukprot:XP_013404370.1 carboxypeptidase N subunit 2 [Lingula anatina]
MFYCAVIFTILASLAAFYPVVSGHSLGGHRMDKSMYLKLTDRWYRWPEKCPFSKDSGCSCLGSNRQKKVVCEGKGVTTLPSFTHLPALSELVLKNTALKGLTKSTFTHVRAHGVTIEGGDLGNRIQLGALDGLKYSLRTLTIKNAALTTLPQGLFRKLRRLRRMKIEGNPDLKILPAGIFSGLRNLQYLFLDNNGLRTLPQDIFSRMSKLNVLSIVRNRLRRLSDNTFSGLSRLESLFLDGNGLTTVPSGLLRALHGLVIVSFKNNKIAKVESKAFEGPLMLQWLDLSDNHLTTVSPCMFSGLDSGVGVNLENNAITCSCALQWWRDVRNVFPMGVCHGPGGAAGKELIEFSNPACELIMESTELLC